MSLKSPRLNFYPVEVSPRQGGKLVTNISAEKAGIQNYTIIRDFRRYVDELLRREGHDYYWPNISGDFATNPGRQPFPNDVTATTLASITRSSTTATATVTLGHMFVEGETVVVSGATPTAYNLTAVISNVTLTTFDYTVSGSPATPATGTLSVKSAMPITLMHQARRPNGSMAIIAGTATRLYRFFALDSGGYFEAAGTGAPYFATSGSSLPYYDDNPGEWIIIGSGYSVDGHRWEHVSINGWSVFSNGVDLPVTYRIEHFEVEPIYEMRENGIASVGTIWEYDGMLMCGDISQIISEKLEEIFLLVGVESSVGVKASQAGTTVTASGQFFQETDLNRWIVFDTGEVDATTGALLTVPVKITGGLPTAPAKSQTATVSVSQTVKLGTFKLRKKASVAGSYFSGLLAGTYVNATQVVSVAGGTTAPVAGQLVRFLNGFSSVVLASPAPTATLFTLTDQMGADITEALPFWIVDGVNGAYADYMLISDSAIFTDQMIGREIVLDTGDVRKIVAYVSATQVRVDSDLTIPLGFFGIDNPAIYGQFTEPEFIDRISWRTINSMIDLPRRWGSAVLGSITSGTGELVLNGQAKSFAVGQEIIISGAGQSGGNLTATIFAIAGSKVLTINTPALTTVKDADVQQLDSVGSVVGFYDLQDDSSAIIAGKVLSRSLVIYKETCIIMAVYTGNVLNPFSFSDPIRIENGATLYYKHTLCDVNSQFHLYAGESSFWRFDLTNQIPLIFESAELCKNIFFSKVTQALTDSIFAENNPLTKEIFFSFPSITSDKLMAFDYLHGEWTTLNTAITAAASVKRQIAGTAPGPTDNWFLMGTADGAVLQYGLANEAVAAWGADIKSIFYRRGANPYTAAKVYHDSQLQSGLSNFGTNLFEKKVRSIALIMSSLSTSISVTMNLYGTRNPAEAVALLPGFPYALLTPLAECAIHLDAQQNYFQLSVTLTGLAPPSNSVSISGIIWEAAIVNANSNRRPSA